MTSLHRKHEHDPDLADYFALPPQRRLALARSHRPLEPPHEATVSFVPMASLRRTKWPRSQVGTLDLLQEGPSDLLALIECYEQKRAI